MGANTRSLRRLTRAIWLVLALNVIDALATLFWVARGNMIVEDEKSALMALALANGHTPFLAAKLTLVTIGCIVIWRGRKCVLAHILFRVPLVAYVSIVLGHAAWAVTVLF